MSGDHHRNKLMCWRASVVKDEKGEMELGPLKIKAVSLFDEGINLDVAGFASYPHISGLLVRHI